jgi:uncharacterized protein involved in exopolysaccharide biosynthesis
MESQFYQINILKVLLKWKMHLAVIVIVAVVVSAIVSGFITPKFKSFAVVYPSNISSYSDESETEQMLQIMQSRDISDRLIEKFNLYQHYKIDTSNKYHITYMMSEYSQNVKVNKTPYEGVNIEVMDADPQVACDMVNAIIDFYNLKVQTLHREKYSEVVGVYKKMVEQKIREIDSVENKLALLRTKYNILDYESQSEEVTKGFLGTVDGDNDRNVNKKEVEKLKGNLEKEGGQFVICSENLKYFLGNYNLYKKEYDEALKELNKNYTYSNIITYPSPADKKAYPVRWLIVVVSSLAAFFLAFLVVLIVENRKGLLQNS